MDEARERIVRNEALFRKVNEAIERGRWQGEEDAPTAFRCECGRLGCSDLIELSLREYERVRTHPRRFVQAVGHVVPEVEQIIATHPGYVVVQKEAEAGRLAEQRDPRT